MSLLWRLRAHRAHRYITRARIAWRDSDLGPLDFTCPGCGYQSVGWWRLDLAVKTARAHFTEHRTGRATARRAQP
jgi:hypothetical protein